MSSLVNVRVEYLREAISSVTRILSGKEIQVTQIGTEAAVICDNQGVPVRVNLPYLPDNASSELVEAVQGFLDSEVSRVINTNYSVMKQVQADNKAVKNLHHVLEGMWCEEKMREQFPGSKFNLANLSHFYQDKVVNKEIEAAGGDPKKMLKACLPSMLRAWAGDENYAEHMEPHWDALKPITDKIPKSFIDGLKNINSTEKAYQAAQDLRKYLLDDEPPKPDEDGDDDQEGNGSGKGEGKGGKGKGNPPPPQDDDEEQEENKGGNPPPKPEEKEEGDDGEGDGDDDEEQEENKGGNPPPKPEEKEEGDDGEGDGDDDEEAAPQEVTLNLKDIEDAASADVSNKMADVIKVQGTHEMKKVKYMPMTIDFDVIEPLPKHKIFHNGEYRSLEKHEVDQVQKDLIRTEEQMRGMIGFLQKDLERIVLSKRKVFWEGGRRTGSVNPGALARIKVGDERVFRKRIEATADDAAVELVIDCSGSMHGGKISLAMRTAIAVAEALTRIGVPHEIIGFTTYDFYGVDKKKKGGKPYSTLVSENRDKYHRFAPIHMPIFKPWTDKRLTQEHKFSMMAMVDHGRLHSNVDGESVMNAAKRLFQRKESKRILMVFSDGYPAANYSDSTELNAHLKSVVKKIEASGIDVFAVGIQDDSPKHFYSKYAVINKIEELPVVVMGKLKEYLR